MSKNDLLKALNFIPFEFVGFRRTADQKLFEQLFEERSTFVSLDTF